jgi:hypothetical protein
MTRIAHAFRIPAAFVLRRLPILCVAILCEAAGGSSPTDTLIVGSRVGLGPLQGIASNAAFSPVNGLIADFNGDGAPDIVVGVNGAPPVLYINNGTASPFDNVPGVFVSPPAAPGTQGLGWGAAVMADVNADGHPDLAIAGFNSPNLVYLNNGTANPFKGATAVNVGTQDESFFVAFGDVNGDGFPDMAVANSNHIPSRLYLTNGKPLTSGSYTTVQIGTDLGYGWAVEIADVNGDGKPDLILTYQAQATTDPSGIAIYLNNGTTNPFNDVSPLRLLVGQTVQAISVADLNGDGKLDLVAAVSNPTLSVSNLYVYLNTGSASEPFGSPQSLEPDTDVYGGCLSIAVGDVNGDGLPDLIFGCAPRDVSTQPLSPAIGAIYLNNGTASPFANVAAVDIPTMPYSNFANGIAIGTLVKNGNPDVLVVDGSYVGSGQSGIAGYDSTKLDQNPVAQNDTAVCAINKSIQIDVLANDTAGPGESLNAKSVTIAGTPQHGTATVNSTTGSVTYQPTTGYSGSDSFQYMVSDGLGAKSNKASVSVRIQPAPIANDDTATLQANHSVTINVLANDTSTGGSLNIASVKIVVAPTHGTTAVTNGAVTYTPASGYSGLDTFQYSVEDNLGTTSNVATVSINVTAPPSSGGGSLDLLDFLVLLGLASMSWSVKKNRRVPLAASGP